MSTAQPEFSRLERLDTMGRTSKPVRIEADADEREGLRRRFRLEALNSLAAEYMLTKDEGKIIANGQIMADLVQACVATAAPVPEKIDEAFTIRFERESVDYDPDAEIELSSDDCDVIFFSGDRIDIGETVAETLSLMMNPYPRAPEADRLLREAGVLGEEEAGPFAKLRELTKKR